MGSGDQIQAIRLGNKYPYLLSHPAGPYNGILMMFIALIKLSVLQSQVPWNTVGAQFFEGKFPGTQ